MATDNNFFDNPADTNVSVPMPTVAFENEAIVKQTVVQPQDRQQFRPSTSPTAAFGIPGTPYDHGVDNPASFAQGEDVVFEAFLYHDGEEVLTSKYTISAIVKTSPYTPYVAWLGTYNNGITNIQQTTVVSGHSTSTNKPGYYKIVIPHETTALLFAGSYFMDIVIDQIVTDGGPSHRAFLYTTSFNIFYSISSPNPESMKGSTMSRINIDRTWPNNPNTVGRYGPL